MQYNTTSVLVRTLLNASQESRDLAVSLADIMSEADAHPEEKKDFRKLALHLLTQYEACAGTFRAHNMAAAVKASIFEDYEGALMSAFKALEAVPTCVKIDQPVAARRAFLAIASTELRFGSLDVARDFAVRAYQASPSTRVLATLLEIDAARNDCGPEQEEWTDTLKETDPNLWSTLCSLPNGPLTAPSNRCEAGTTSRPSLISDQKQHGMFRCASASSKHNTYTYII